MNELREKTLRVHNRMSSADIYDKCARHPSSDKTALAQQPSRTVSDDATLASHGTDAPPVRETKVDNVIPAVGIICFWVA